MTPNLQLRSFTNDQYYLDKVFYANFYRIKGVESDSAPKPVVVDIGAHCGYFSFLALTAGAKCVYAFEPFLENYKMLLKNVGDNPIGPVYSYQMGVYTSRRVLNLAYPALKNGIYFDFASVGLQEGDQKIACQFVTLDDIFESFVPEPIDILKLSMGYAEPDVLLGSELLYKKVKHICGESFLEPDAVTIFKSRMSEKGFTDFRSQTVQGEEGKVLFHLSSTKCSDAFLDPLPQV
jgi:FkbM family methyltransferase